MRLQLVEKRLQRLELPFDLDADRAGLIADKAGELQPRRQSMDERPKTHPLNHASHGNRLPLPHDHHRYEVWHTGNWIVKVDPSPGVLSSWMEPPMASQIFLVMARPSPVPPNLRVVEASACVNG